MEPQSVAAVSENLTDSRHHVRLNLLCPQGCQVGAGWALQGEEGFAGRCGLMGEGFGVAASGGVNDEERMREGGNELVSAGCQSGGLASDVWGERGEDEQAAVAEDRVPAPGDWHVVDAAGWSDDDRPAPTEEEALALLLHRWLPDADDGLRCVVQGAGEVISLEDEIAGTAMGTDHVDGASPIRLELPRWAFSPRSDAAYTADRLHTARYCLRRDFVALRPLQAPAWACATRCGLLTIVRLPRGVSCHAISSSVRHGSTRSTL